jgi:NAD(P)-dependent dehydrogenase (short-subunit alcohol dehydrogenase family)
MKTALEESIFSESFMATKGTPMFKGKTALVTRSTSGEHDVLHAAQPTKRFVAVEEIAGLVAFLCSKGAASITGSLLLVDGGWTAQ